MPDETAVAPEQTLEEWLAKLATELGVPGIDSGQITQLLDLARDTAHGVARPAAPLSAFLAGVAVGRGTPLADVIDCTHSALVSP